MSTEVLTALASIIVLVIYGLIQKITTDKNAKKDKADLELKIKQISSDMASYQTALNLSQDTSKRLTVLLDESQQTTVGWQLFAAQLKEQVRDLTARQIDSETRHIGEMHKIIHEQRNQGEYLRKIDEQTGELRRKVTGELR
jgi:hypothetical protein